MNFSVRFRRTSSTRWRNFQQNRYPLRLQSGVPNPGMPLAIALQRPTQVQPQARALRKFFQTRFVDFRKVNPGKILNFLVRFGRTSSIRWRNFQQNRYRLRPQSGVPNPGMPL